MSNQAAVRIESVTSLLGFRSTRSMSVRYSYPDAPTPRIPYTKLRIYRYIGKINDCLPPLSVNDPGVVFVNEVDEATVLSQSGSPIGTVFTYIDNLSSRWSSGSTVLRNQHALTDAVHDQQIMHEVMYTRRAMYYLVESFKRGVSEFIPYFVTPYTSNNSIASYSTKTQVLHDVFHQEGDCVWHTSLAPGAVNHSRTAVNILPVIRNERDHVGPAGIGGYVWVSDRRVGGERVYRLSLNTGVQRGATDPLPNNTTANGHAVTIDSTTGDCYSSPRNSPVRRIWRHSNSDSSNTTATTHIPSQEIVSQSGDPGPLPLYGAVQRFGTNQHFGVVFNTGAMLFNPTARTAQLLFTEKLYGVASSRDGFGWAGRWEPPTDQFVIGRYTFGQVSPTWKVVSAPRINFEGNDGRIGGVGVGVDAINKPSIFQEDRYRIGYTNADVGRIMEYNPVTDDVEPRIDVMFRGSRGIGVDGDNNWYGVGTLGEKFYSCKHSSDFDEKGGLARYPAITLSRWFGSVVNTREIEWFMTRNGHIGDPLHCRVNYTSLEEAFKADSTETLLDGNTLETGVKNYHQANFGTPPTGAFDVGLDNTVVRNWATGLPSNPGPQTAQQAWSWIVAGNIPGVGSNIGDFRAPLIGGRSINFLHVDDRPGGWNPQYHNGVVAGNTKMWGKRLYEVVPSNPALTRARIALVVQYIRAWSTTFTDDALSYAGIPNRIQLIQKNLVGARLYPHYLGDDISPADFPMSITDPSKRKRIERRTVCVAGRHDGYSYCYSDFTGSILAASVQEISYGVDVSHPAVIAPAMTSDLVSVSQTSPIGESGSQFVWNTLTTQGQSVTGFDDITVQRRVITAPGTFIISGISISLDDLATDYKGNSNPTTVSNNINSVYNYTGNYITSQTISHTYHDPSKIGLPGSRTNNPSTTGTFSATAAALTNRNVYTCQEYSLVSYPLNTTVYERWPRGRLSIQGEDGKSVRYPWLGATSCNHSWGSEARFDKLYAPGAFVNGSVSTGVDPVSAKLFDRTIARTYPVSSFELTISAFNPWSAEIQSWAPGSTAGFTITSIPITLPAIPADTRIEDTSRLLIDRVWRYGTYTAALTVSAENSNTPGADNAGQQEVFSHTVSVADFEPFANFWATSAQTVPATYKEETSAVNARTILIPTVTTGPIISGYAPNLTVWFQDSSEAHTFPISSYHWDFGDYYDEATNTVTITTTAHTGIFDEGCWHMTGFTSDKPGILVRNQESHWVKHTYVMPGVYDVTLCAQASNTQTQDCCAKFVGQQFYIYVEEIPPECCFVVSTDTIPWTSAPALTGDSPFTLYTLASCVTAGSFPICKIDYDWGDGTPIESVSRVSSLTGTSLGTPITSTGQNADDVKDPRFFIVPHQYVYSQATPSTTYAISITAYACNTNTSSICTGRSITVNTSYEEVYDTRHLLNSRFIGDSTDKIYVFESENLQSTMHIAVSGGVQR